MSKFVFSCALSLLVAVVRGEEDDLNFVQTNVGSAQVPSLEECRAQAEKVGEQLFKDTQDWDATRQAVVDAVKKCMGQDASGSAEAANVVAEHVDMAAKEGAEEAQRSTDMSKTSVDEAKAAAAKSSATDAEERAAEANAVAAQERSKAADAILNSEVAALGVARARVASGEAKVVDFAGVLQDREKGLASAVERLRKAEVEEAEKKDAFMKQKELEAAAEAANQDAQRKAEAANEQLAKDRTDLDQAVVEAKIVDVDPLSEKVGQDDPVVAVSEDLKLKQQVQYDAQTRVATAENISAGGANTMLAAMEQLTEAAGKVHEAMGMYLTASQKAVWASRQRKDAAQTKLTGAQDELDGFKEALAKQKGVVSSANQTAVEAADDARTATNAVKVVARAAEAAGMTAEKTQDAAEKSVVKAVDEVAAAEKAVKDAPSDLSDVVKSLKDSKKDTETISEEAGVKA